LAEVQLADDERMSLLAMDAVAVVNAAARGTGDGGRGGGGGGWGRKRAVEECEVREMSLRRTSIKYAPAGTEFEQSAVGNGGGCSVGMRHADVGRGDGTRRNDDVEVGDVARVRGSGAAARAGLEPFGATICESSEGVVSRESHATGGCDSAGGGGGAIRAVEHCDVESVEVCAGVVDGVKRCSAVMRHSDIATGLDGSRAMICETVVEGVATEVALMTGGGDSTTSVKARKAKASEARRQRNWQARQTTTPS